MVSADNACGNQLLAALPDARSQRIPAPAWRPWTCPSGRCCTNPAGKPATLFPTAIVSLLYVMENGASAEIAVVGNEGIVGISSSWAAKPPQPGGGAERRARAAAAQPAIKDEFNCSRPGDAPAAATPRPSSPRWPRPPCAAATHSTSEHCRWLLLSLDRLSGQRFR